MFNWLTTNYEVISLVVSVCGYAMVGWTLRYMQSQTKAISKQTNLLSKQAESMSKQTELMSTQAESGIASMRSNAYQSYATQMFTVDTIFLRYPKLRRYFHSQVEIDRKDPDYDRTIAIAELFLDYIDTVLVQEKQLPELWPKTKWDPYFKEMFINSPILQTHLDEHKDWYTEELIELMEDGKNRRSNNLGL